MTKDDHRAPKPPPDPDRAAILARRQHFIALALTGLASTACTAGEGGGQGTKGDSKGQVTPQPCLKDGTRNEQEGESGPEQPPQPCLSIAPPEPPPQVCLKIALPDPEDETGDGGETGSEGDTGAPEVAPKVCLSKTAPKPCLKKKSPEPKPTPCLRKVSPDSDLD